MTFDISKKISNKKETRIQALGNCYCSIERWLFWVEAKSCSNPFEFCLFLIFEIDYSAFFSSRLFCFFTFLTSFLSFLKDQTQFGTFAWTATMMKKKWLFSFLFSIKNHKVLMPTIENAFCKQIAAHIHWTTKRTNIQTTLKRVSFILVQQKCLTIEWNHIDVVFIMKFFINIFFHLF